MPAVSRLGDSAFSAQGSGYKCLAPTTITIASASSRAYADGIQIARGNVDKVAGHPIGGCGADGSLIISSSSRVYVEGNPASRIGDSAASDNTITSGSSRVFFG
jgi:uncharacterized Zn-binding protein involved in type VI secretion